MFTDGTNINIENTKETPKIKKLLELISNYMVAGFKVKNEKSIFFLYANNKQLEFEVKRTSFILTPKNFKDILRYNAIKICI